MLESLAPETAGPQKDDMSDPQSGAPRVRIDKIYTRTGDEGRTRLASGRMVSKADPRLECYGTIDELNAFVGMARLTASGLSAREPRLKPLADSLLRVQHELFNAGSILAADVREAGEDQAAATARAVVRLEREIDAAAADLPRLESFVLPGGSRLNVELHACRTVCRRAERLVAGLAAKEHVPSEVLRYLNRLSDAFFAWSRWVNHLLHVDEVLWNPSQADSAPGDG